VNTVGLDPALLADLERETSELLSRLIQIDTSNPPGNETRVAECMAAWFGRHGLEGEIVGEPAERASFVLRLEGRRPGPTLLLLAHEDVVPANAADWQVPPFSGLIKDGYVWGRGALDIKNLVAANAVAVRRLAAAGAPFDGTVTFACTADEERCAGGGVRWLLEHRPDLMRCDYVLNEGDGAYIACGDRRLFMLQSGEKGAAQFRIVVHGRAGHGHRYRHAHILHVAHPASGRALDAAGRDHVAPEIHLLTGATRQGSPIRPTVAETQRARWAAQRGGKAVAKPAKPAK